MVEDGYEFFAKRQLVTIFSAPNYCGEFDNAGSMMSVDESLMCSFQVCVHVRMCVCMSVCTCVCLCKFNLTICVHIYLLICELLGLCGSE